MDHLGFNPLHPDFIADPHQSYHRLRQDDPVHFSSVYGCWVLTRYRDVVTALNDPRFSSDTRRWVHYETFFTRGGATGDAAAHMYRNWMLQTDPPTHTRLRTLVNKAFTPRVVERMRPTIETLVDRLLTTLSRRVECDFITEFAYPLPLMVIARLLGLPKKDFGTIMQWSTELLPSFSPALSKEQLSRVNTSVSSFTQYFTDAIRQRQQKIHSNSGDTLKSSDLLDTLIAARENEDRLNDEELRATCVLLTFAGHMTTVQLLAHCVLLFLNNPEQLDKLELNPQLVSSAVEEALRMSSPLQIVYRTTTEPVALGNKTIPENQMVIVSLAAANRDPEQFSNPDFFDISRSTTGRSPQIAFGHGIHYCVGAALGRLEAEVALQQLIPWFPRFKVDTDQIERENSLMIRGLTRLRLRIDYR